MVLMVKSLFVMVFEVESIYIFCDGSIVFYSAYTINELIMK